MGLAWGCNCHALGERQARPGVVAFTLHSPPPLSPEVAAPGQGLDTACLRPHRLDKRMATSLAVYCWGQLGSPGEGHQPRSSQGLHPAAVRLSQP